MADNIKQFLAAKAFAVAGASQNRAKYGNKVLRCYLQNNKVVYPLHPLAERIEGVACFASVADLPDSVGSLSIITPPQVTTNIVREAIAKKIDNIWMQPGAESREALELCETHGVNVIAGGPCLLVVLGYSEV